eukprot:scaffold503600_cov28-Prasinocladus_malaysianus.AAC.1
MISENKHLGWVVLSLDAGVHKSLCRSVQPRGVLPEARRNGRQPERLAYRAVHEDELRLSGSAAASIISLHQIALSLKPQSLDSKSELSRLYCDERAI